MEYVAPKDNVHVMPDSRQPVTEPHVLLVRQGFFLTSSCDCLGTDLTLSFFFSDIDFFLVSLPVGIYPVCRQTVQVITPPVNKGFLRIPSSINNYYKYVPSAASEPLPLVRRAPRHARHVPEELQAITSSVLLVSLLLTAHVYRPMQMAFVKSRVLSLTTINGNVMVSCTVQISFIY